MQILCTVDIRTRELYLEDVTIAAFDHLVDDVLFVIEPIDGFQLETSTIKIAAVGPLGEPHDYEIDPSTVTVDEETGNINFIWSIPVGVTAMPLTTFKISDTKKITFAVCAEIVSGDNLVKAWHSDDGTIKVKAHLEPEAGGGEDPEEEATNAQKIAQLQTDVAVINTQVGALANGSPTPVAIVAEMTDESAVYLYTGSETGYTAGNWYYYNGSAWTSGGVYGGAVTSTTFNQHGVPADDFAVGEALADKADADDVTSLGTRVTAVDGEIDALKDFNAVQLIPDHADVQSKTESGLTWSCSNGVFAISGTAASSWFENIYNSPDSIPEWFSEGNKLFIKLNKSGSNTRYIYFRIYVYKQDGTTENIAETYNDTVFTVPNIDDAVGIYARVFVLSGNTVSGSIHPVISNAPSNLELSDSIESTDTSVNTLQNTFESTDAKDTIDLVPRLSNGDTVKNGVTFSYLNGTTTINGTATSATYFKLCGDTNSLPDGIIAGRRYFIDIAHNGGTTARVRVECKVDGATSYIYDGDKSTPLLIPSGATGLAIYIYVYSTGVVENESITVSFRRALTNFALSNSILPPNPGAMMTIIDDDGALGFYTQLLPIIRAKHIPIASAIVGSKIGVNPAYMTWEQVEECFADGAEILNHTYMHYGETDETRPTNEIRMDYTRNANLMWAHNIPTGDILVYPGGSGNLITAQVAAKRFASAAFRANGNKLNLINQTDPFYIDRYRIESDYSYDIDQMKGLIDNCIAKGGWMVWMIHTSSGYNWNENALSAVSQSIDYAISSGLPIVTARYGIERYIKKRLY